ncbi:hypothetical protein [Sphingobacterium sp. JUb56]|uniref:hypothetical protein n=1 Tax=Sphingobacterium sp. JUb56 TaxID=2587145 RepID=UPI0016077175|nr:hypothetical protein [Sphingobacterium sp. JUb56]MBB2952986.1 natural product precursor [Sphingobacterium sp. JUb56]
MMKKISLKKLNLQDVEQLSREQLKNVLGGYSGGTTAPGPPDDPTTTLPEDNGNIGKSCIVYSGIHDNLPTGTTWTGTCQQAPWYETPMEICAYTDGTGFSSYVYGCN